MSRIRSLKPDFFLDDELAELDHVARLVFAGLWCLADREGRLVDNHKKIKVQLLPYEKCDMNAILETLTHKPFIIRYAVDGHKYIQIVNFLEHQRPHHTEAESIIPIFNGDLTVRQPLRDGECRVGKERKGKERKEVGASNDADYLLSLKNNKAYSHINIDIEIEKMKVWLGNHAGRKLTRRFMVNWLNKIEAPFSTTQHTPTQDPDPDCKLCGGSGVLVAQGTGKKNQCSCVMIDRGELCTR